MAIGLAALIGGLALYFGTSMIAASKAGPNPQPGTGDVPAWMSGVALLGGVVAVLGAVIVVGHLTGVIGDSTDSSPAATTAGAANGEGPALTTSPVAPSTTSVATTGASAQTATSSATNEASASTATAPLIEPEGLVDAWNSRARDLAPDLMFAPVDASGPFVSFVAADDNRRSRFLSISGQQLCLMNREPKCGTEPMISLSISTGPAPWGGSDSAALEEATAILVSVFSPNLGDDDQASLVRAILEIVDKQRPNSDCPFPDPGWWGTLGTIETLDHVKYKVDCIEYLDGGYRVSLEAAASPASLTSRCMDLTGEARYLCLVTMGEQEYESTIADVIDSWIPISDIDKLEWGRDICSAYRGSGPGAYLRETIEGLNDSDSLNTRQSIAYWVVMNYAAATSECPEFDTEVTDFVDDYCSSIYFSVCYYLDEMS